jgi:hypothetical protein
MSSQRSFDPIAKKLAFTEMRVNGKLYYRDVGRIKQNVGDSVTRGGKVGFKTKAELLKSLKRQMGYATLSALNKAQPKYHSIIIRGYDNYYDGRSRWIIDTSEQRYFLYTSEKPRRRK